MKRYLLTILLFLCCLSASSRHIKGGFFNYQYLGPGVSDQTALRYNITLTVYMDCNATGGQIDNNVFFTIFNGNTSSQYKNINVQKSASSPSRLSKGFDDPCISGDQAICYYIIVVYETTVELPVSADGYTISYQRCCRIENMDNIVSSGTIGNTYTIKIPGTSSLVPDANKNNSPTFPINDTAVICENSFFRYPFSATDIDGDTLRYSFCTSYAGANQTDPGPPVATPPPYSSVPYFSSYSGSTPMGPSVTINAETGLISGTAPPIYNTGEYALTVCVSEFRKGVLIGTTRKELHIRVRDCSVTSAFLNPIPTSCDGFNVSFKNDAVNPSGIEYMWQFGDASSGILDTSTLATPIHVYADTGIYLLKLNVTIGGICPDSTTAIVKVYPGFFPGFRINAPLCEGAPVQFTDTTKARFGTPTGWQWNFGDVAVTTDTSNAKNPSYIFPDSGTYKVQMIVGSTFGCIDTVNTDVYVNPSPMVNVLTHDTLICIIDTLQLTTTNTGNFLWSPNYNINSISSASPLVSPDVPTTYFVKYTDGLGCSNIDSVFINVKSFVTINTGPDTTICRTDGVQLNTISDALHYVWTPATDLSSDTAKSPIANPLVSSVTYKVMGNIGKCQNTSTVTIKTLPYPPAYAGRDTTVCFGVSNQLMASGGLYYDWSPATFLNATNISNPVATNPTVTTQYIVAVRDIVGCLKPAFDTVLLTVDPFVFANAGPSDTSLVLGQPLYLNGTGGATYLWTPSTWLSNPGIPNPVSSPQDNITYKLLVTSAAGCQNTDTINVKVYKVSPSIYVPTAFSPNNDGNNDVLKPILLGMQTLNYFRVFDRWGNLMFTTSQQGQGWDGSFKGNPQDLGTFVWMAQGTTYTGEVISLKGYTVLVR